MFRKTWVRYSTNPTRTVIESYHAPVALIPFPAITICPLVFPSRARREKVLRSLQLPPNMSNKTADFLLTYVHFSLIMFIQKQVTLILKKKQL